MDYTLLKYLTYLFLAFLGFQSVNAQDLVYSQYYSNPLHYNSAFAGTVAYPRFATNYRIQWPGLVNVYESYSLSYDQYLPSKNLSFGAVVGSDDQGAGTLKETSFRGIVAYNLTFQDDWQIKFGIGTKFVQNRLNWDKLIFFDQLDPITGPLDRSGNPNISSEVRPASLDNKYLDIDLGLLVYNPNYYLGISLFHANSPYIGFVNNQNGIQEALPVLFALQLGYQLDLVKDNKGSASTFISPSLLVTRQAGFTQMNLGAYIQKDVIFGGLWLRHTVENFDALIFSFGVVFNNLKIGYSYDLTSSNLSLGTTRGSHELGISLGLKHLEKKVSKLNDCFSLFR